MEIIWNLFLTTTISYEQIKWVCDKKYIYICNIYKSTIIHALYNYTYKSDHYINYDGFRLLCSTCIFRLKDENGNTPLHHLFGTIVSDSIYELFSDRGILQLDINSDLMSIQNNDGDTPLHLLFSRIHIINKYFYEIILFNTKLMFIQNNNGYIPLHLLFKTLVYMDITFYTLLSNTNYMDIRSNNGNTILHHLFSKITITKEQKDDINKETEHYYFIRNNFNKTPFFYLNNNKYIK
jgi:ankyrin repeat protein